MICNGCNASLTGTHKFCPKCGEKVVTEHIRHEVNKKCPQCGTENSPTARFCKVDGFRFDGKALEATVAATDPVPIAPPATLAPTASVPETPRPASAAALATDMLVCPHCGTQNLPNAKFCKKDGVPLAGTSGVAVVQEVTPPPAKPAKTEAPAQVSQPANASGQVKSTVSKSKTPMIAALVVALAAAGGAGYWYLNKQRAQETAIEAPSAEPVTTTPPTEASKSAALTPEILKANISKALSDAGLSKVGATVDEDFDVELGGEVTSAQEKTKAFNIVKSVTGVAYITNNILGPNDDPDAPWKPEDIAHMVNKEMSKSVGAGKTRAPLSPEELSVLRQTKGAESSETENMQAYDALIKAMKNVKEPLSHEKIQEILKTYPAPPPVATVPAEETQVSESQPSPSVHEEVSPTPQNKVSNPPPETVQKAAIVKQPPKKTEQVQIKKAKSESHVPPPVAAPESAAPSPQSPPPSEQKPAEQPATPPAEQPKKHHGLRGLIESTTGVDPGATAGTAQHECTSAEKSMHISGC